MSGGPIGPVPHNRWDLLDLPQPTPSVSVVVLHYCQEQALDRVLGALERQTLLPTEVVVTDDGSPQASRAVADRFPVHTTTQADLGFRAARARNRGAQLCIGEVLVFLDADCVPDPRLLEALTRRMGASRDLLAVGSRRHAELAGLARGEDPSVRPRLPAPEWLADGYQRSADLLHADGRSFRYIISAVLACPAALFRDLGGFDERFEGYGGEDWDLGYRAWNNGAVLVHEPGAVVWHDGPEAAARGAIDRRRRDQAIRLAGLIPEPLTRGAALPAQLPDVLVDALAGDDPTAQVQVLHSLARQTFRDLGVRCRTPPDPAVAELYEGWLRPPWTTDQCRRARARLTAWAPLPPDALRRAMEVAIDGDLGRVELRSGGQVVAVLRTTRLFGRRRRWAGVVDRATVDASLGAATVEVGALAPGPANLEDWLAAPRP